MLAWFAGSPHEEEEMETSAPNGWCQGSPGEAELTGRKVGWTVRSLVNQSPLSPIGHFGELSSSEEDMDDMVEVGVENV